MSRRGLQDRQSNRTPVQLKGMKTATMMSLMVTGAVIVKKPLETPKHLIAKPRIPSKPIKKAPSKQRRLGLSKSGMKKDVRQPSLLESLAKFQFKKSCL
ncbi:hypothetical protein MTO96_018986 [Rhipicephalus appendiculatus]